MRKRLFICLLLFCYIVQCKQDVFVSSNSEGSACYDNFGKAQRCMPEFVNAAFGASVHATNTCGVINETNYCLQTGVTGVNKACFKCNSHGDNHPPEFMTDFNNQDDWSWWQSITMLEGVQYPNTVNITLNLRKAFDITYVRIRFTSPRPESFAIYKRSSEDGPWVPYQFYSASCESTYNLPRQGIITEGNEKLAICTDEFSEISPLTGGSVAFSTLEGRPSAFEFSNSASLQEWVTATDIKIVLTRMNTFGDEVFGDPKVLKSYFYAISDLAVGARCKCNGHGSLCEVVRDQNLDDHLVCQCEHFTSGPDCEKCLHFYNDKPWAGATESSANKCQPCSCSGMSDSCYFDRDLYEKTGHGGHCEDCRENTDGPHCERCMQYHYLHQTMDRCMPCGCNDLGSETLQCNDQGQCGCKVGVGGDRCDRCLADFFDFSDTGCQPCACLIEGSLYNEPRCDSITGECWCKVNVQGRRCDVPKSGYFGIDIANPFGALSCFCYGHSSLCKRASGYRSNNISTTFSTGSEGWTSVSRAGDPVAHQFNGFMENVGAQSEGVDVIYFVAPERYLFDQRFSYSRFLSFDLRIGEESALPSVLDVVLESGDKRLATHIFAQGNPVPGVVLQSYVFRLHEDLVFQWSPRLKPKDFISILANITALKIRVTYNKKGVGFVDNIKLGTAVQTMEDGPVALWVEQCICHDGYIGQFCESCAPGFHRDTVNGGPLSRCVPCRCNGHSDVCDVSTGRCICEHNTEGANCERCVRGFYGSPTLGTPDDCHTCPCPKHGPCLLQANRAIICTECDEGHGGNLCDVCLDGFYGDPAGRHGSVRQCQPCQCNGNIDLNAINNCNVTTGECLRCIHNTAGFHCEECSISYYGDALVEPKGQCSACQCNPVATASGHGHLECDPMSGQCPCLSNVVGRQCERCELGYWNINTGTGCEPCDCDRIGSANYTCHPDSGQCHCQAQVTGRRCDICQHFTFGFSLTGCQACNCDPLGSLSYKCDQDGYCSCRPNAEGRRCDHCQENKFNMSAGCLNCPQCYDLVQERVNVHRRKLGELVNLIDTIGSNQTLFNDTEFLAALATANDSIADLLNDARAASAGSVSTNMQLQRLQVALQGLLEKCEQITRRISAGKLDSNHSAGDILVAETAIRRAVMALRDAEDYIGREGKQALFQALDALDQFGKQSQQMTVIAQRATELSLSQKMEAQAIHNMALNALNTSREAQRLAEETVRMPESNHAEIIQLERELFNARAFYERTEVVAEMAFERANDAHDEAVDIYREAQSPIADTNVDALSREALDIKDEAAKIKLSAQRLMANNQDLLSEVEQQENALQITLTNSTEAQQHVDDLLAEVESARDTAKKAVQSAEETLSEANETLKTLLEFDQLVSENKDAADEALNKIPDIETLIGQARNITKAANNILHGVEFDAKEGLRLAALAETTAAQASEAVSSIVTVARETRAAAISLRQKSEELSTEVSAARSRAEDYAQQADTDEMLIDEARKKARAAQITADDAVASVNETLTKVTDIKNILTYLDDVDADRLVKLEAELDRLEAELNSTNIDTEVQTLVEQNERIKCWREKYEGELVDLRHDVDNIAAIRNSLPNNCFKTIEIESRIGL